MSTLLNNSVSVLAKNVSFTESMLCVELMDGRIINTPLVWFSKLANASIDQLNNWRLIGRGVGIHWEDLDEDISVAGLLK